MGKLKKKSPLPKYKALSLHEKLAAEQKRQQMVDEILQKVENTKTEAMMLSFGAAMKEVLNLDNDIIFKVLQSADDKMGKYNTIESLDAFRSHIIEAYGFDIRTEPDERTSPSI